MYKRNIYILAGGTILILLMCICAIIALYIQKVQLINAVDSFEECAATGAPILESYPEQCIFNGKSYTRQLTDDEKDRLQPPVSY